MLTLDNRQLSASIRAKKKKMAESEPEMIGTSPVPDLNAQDIYDIDKHAQVEETVGSEKKINADQTNLDEPYNQEAMSHEPMESEWNPQAHDKMAYGGMVEEHSDPMMPSKEMGEEIAGSMGTRSEMNRRIGEGFQKGPMQEGKRSMPSRMEESEIGGASGEDAEMKRRTIMRKMRLSSYLDNLSDW